MMLLTTTPVATATETELCFGQVPTIVGTPGDDVLQGTEGTDVVITNGALGANLLGGDDLLCATDVVPSGDSRFDTGSGNDRIDASLTVGYNATFYLGPGSDEFIGSDEGQEIVVAADASAGDPDADIISTGGSRDNVTTSGSDLVDLGGAFDQLYVIGDSTGADYVGGQGSDRFVLDTRPHHAPHNWILNSSTGRLTRDAKAAASFRGFHYFETAIAGSLTVIGSEADETVRMAYGWLAREAAVDVRVRGGDDYVVFWGGTPGGRFDGGEGSDRFVYARVDDRRLPDHASILFDLASGLLRDTWPGGETTRQALQFEKTRIYTGYGYPGGPVTIKGTSGPDVLKATKVPADVTIFGEGRR